MPELIDITGRTFGELTVLRMADVKVAGRPAWVCRCVCGKEVVAHGHNLRCGDKTTCGAHRSKSFIAKHKARPGANRIYPKGTDTHSRIYTLWNAIVARCYRPSHEAYCRYGGRGILMCDAWRSFANFREWALSSGYSEHLTIDRLDNDKGYEPGNCRWATRSEQANNRRNTIRVNAFGETKTVTEWPQDQRCLVDARKLWKRLRYGHHPEFAMTATEAEIRHLAGKTREAERRRKRELAASSISNQSLSSSSCAAPL